ncbi:MAG: hypothetical protein IPN17_35305 [Deltaproteobacteria bacterium]|jgi:hypothetical protein|nr:hypothetical protein [Deltaproteobacteria bacterium]MBP6830912.1 hypothetical protein [Deltaproteobacteria bacterium]
MSNGAPQSSTLSLGAQGGLGASTGGASTGGASTGGASTGGASTGGASTGGASSDADASGDRATVSHDD